MREDIFGDHFSLRKARIRRSDLDHANLKRDHAIVRRMNWSLPANQGARRDQGLHGGDPDGVSQPCHARFADLFFCPVESE